MNEYNIKVNFEKGTIESDIIELVVNDYNSTKLNFEFDKEEGRNVFKLLYPDGTFYVDDIANNELILEKGILNQNGKHLFEITKYGNDDRLTVFCTQEMYVRLELANTDEITKPDDRVPILDNLINEVSTIKQDVEDGKYNGKDGQDGVTPTIGENGNWYIGDTDTGLPSRGETGKAGSVKFIVANELPSENIEENAIYMVPSEDPQEENTYQEYIYVNGAWESLGGASVQVDMTDYPTKNEMKEITGELENLGTEDKSNLVSAINEVMSNSGGSFCEYVETSWDNFITNVSTVGFTTDANRINFINAILKATDNSNKNGSVLVRDRTYNSITFFNVKMGVIGGSNGKTEIKLKYFSFSPSYNTDSLEYDFYTGYGTLTITTKNEWSRLTSNSVKYDFSEMATKKYIDDTIANAITTTLEGSY